MSYHDFVIKLYNTSSPMRTGQLAMNMLWNTRPGLYEQVQGDSVIDPFYDDNKLGSFLMWLAENW